MATARKVQEENAMFAQEIRGKEDVRPRPTAHRGRPLPSWTTTGAGGWMAIGHSAPPSALTASLSFENEKR